MPLRSGVFTGCAQPNRSNDNAPSLGRCAPGKDFHQDGPTLLLQAPSEPLPQPRHGARSSAPSSSDSTLSGLPGRQAPGSNKTDDFSSHPHQTPPSSPTSHGNKCFFLSGATATPFERLQLLYHPQHFPLAFTRLQVYPLLARALYDTTAPSNVTSSSSICFSAPPLRCSFFYANQIAC